jgi:hypothetical protein
MCCCCGSCHSTPGLRFLALLTEDACNQLTQRHASAHGNLHQRRHKRALVRAEEIAYQAEDLQRGGDRELRRPG